MSRTPRVMGEVTKVWGSGPLAGQAKVYMRYAYPKGRKQRSYLAEAKEAQYPRNCGADGFCLSGGVIDAGEIYLLIGDFAGVPVKNQHRRPNRESYHTHCAEFMGYGHAARHLNPKI